MYVFHEHRRCGMTDTWQLAVAIVRAECSSKHIPRIKGTVGAKAPTDPLLRTNKREIGERERKSREKKRGVSKD